MLSFHSRVLLCAQEENRRFRIQLSATPPSTYIDTCREFVAAIAHLIPVKELGSTAQPPTLHANEPLSDSQASYEDLQLHDRGTRSCFRQTETGSRGASAGTSLQGQNVDVIPSDSELVTVQQRAQVCNKMHKCQQSLLCYVRVHLTLVKVFITHKLNMIWK